MNEYTVKRLALISALNARVAGMNAENENRKQNNDTMAYGDKEFNNIADELEKIAYLHDHQL